MAASYPGTRRDFPTHVNTTEVIDASHMNEVQDEITAIQAAVGTNPQVSTAGGGSSFGAWSGTARTYSSLADRLANIEAGLTADTHTQYVRFAGTETITGIKTFSGGNTFFGSGTGSSNGIVYLQSGTTGGEATVQWRDGAAARWAMYRLATGADIYLRDMVNARQHVAYAPGASNTAASTTFNSNVVAQGNLSAAGTLSVTGTSSLAAITGTNLTLTGTLTVPSTGGTVAGASAVGDAAAAGTSTQLARADHRHGREAFSATAPVVVTAGGASAVGASTSPARSDHSHGLAAGVVPTTSAVGAAAAEGISTSVARADHVHGREAFGATISTITPQSTASAAGTATTPARSDHVHGNAAPVTPSTSVVGAAAAIGTSTAFALGDHVHAREAFGAAPPAVNVTAGATGAATTLARSDHNHSVSVGSPVALTSFGLTAGDGTSIALSRADHSHGTPPAPTPASVGAVAKAGDTMTGGLTVGSGVGNVRLQPGTGTNAGYIEFYSTSASARQGYIGYSTTTATLDVGTVPYVAGTHAFTGAITSTGTITENGNRVYSAANPQPIPLAGTVVAETSFGLASAVGTSTSLARADHTHGTPAAQTLASLAAMGTAGGTFTGGVSITGQGAPGGHANTSLRIATANPQIEFYDTDLAAGSAGRRYWIHHNSGVLYFLRDADDNNTWDTPHPLYISANGHVTAGIQLFEAGNRVYSAANPPPIAAPVVIMPFFVGGSIGVGLRRPEFIATVPMTIRGARSRSYAGTGSYQIYVNGASVSGAAAAFGTAQALHDFADVNINAGDRVQVNIASASADAVDLSVTVDVVTR